MGVSVYFPFWLSASSFSFKPSIFDPASAAPRAAPVTAPLAADDTTAATASFAMANRPFRLVELRLELFFVEDVDPDREAPELDFPFARDDDPVPFELDRPAFDPLFAREDDPAFFAVALELPEFVELFAVPDFELPEPDLDELFAVPDLELPDLDELFAVPDPEVPEPDRDELFAVPDFGLPEPDLDELFAVPDLELLDFAPAFVPDEDAVFLDDAFAPPARELDELLADLDLDVDAFFPEAVFAPPEADLDFVFVVAIIPPLSIELNFYDILSRACFARAAPIAVFTSFSSSGGGSTAGIPSDSIQSSRVQPVV